MNTVTHMQRKKKKLHCAVFPSSCVYQRKDKLNWFKMISASLVNHFITPTWENVENIFFELLKFDSRLTAVPQ